MLVSAELQGSAELREDDRWTFAVFALRSGQHVAWYSLQTGRQPKES